MRSRDAVAEAAKPRTHVFGLFLLASVLLLGLIIAELLVGSGNVTLSDVLQAPSRPQSLAQIIIETIRLPRALAAVLVGAALAATGVIMQTVLRNPWPHPTYWLSPAVPSWPSLLPVYCFHSHFRAFSQRSSAELSAEVSVFWWEADCARNGSACACRGGNLPRLLGSFISDCAYGRRSGIGHSFVVFRSSGAIRLDQGCFAGASNTSRNIAACTPGATIRCYGAR